jgi:hypothetical protein
MHQKAPGPTTVPIGNVRHRDLRGRPFDELISGRTELPTDYVATAGGRQAVASRCPQADGSGVR